MSLLLLGGVRGPAGWPSPGAVEESIDGRSLVRLLTPRSSAVVVVSAMLFDDDDDEDDDDGADDEDDEDDGAVATTVGSCTNCHSTPNPNHCRCGALTTRPLRPDAPAAAAMADEEDEPFSPGLAILIAALPKCPPPPNSPPPPLLP